MSHEATNNVVDDSMRQYLRKIGGLERSSNQQERAAIAQLKSSDPLEYEAGRSWLVKANLATVVSLAKKYARSNVSFMDLLQEGNIGLLKATETYDFEKGYRFLPHAIWWIRQSMALAVAAKAQEPPIPTVTLALLKQALKAQHELCLANGTTPSPEEVAAHLDAPPEDIREVLQLEQLVLVEEPTIPES